MNKTVVIGLLVILSMVGLFIWGGSTSKTSVPGVNGVEAKSVLEAPETFYDFGNISMKNGKVEKSFMVTNTGNADLEIKTVQTSCMCTAAYLETKKGEMGPFGMAGMGYLPPANETLESGESRKIRVVYDPNAHGPAGVGPIDRFVYVTDEHGGTLELEIKALVTP